METAEAMVVSNKYDEMVELIKKLVLISDSLTQGHVHITFFNAGLKEKYTVSGLRVWMRSRRSTWKNLY